MQVSAFNRGTSLSSLLLLTTLLMLPVSPEGVRAQSDVATNHLPWSPTSLLRAAAQAAESARNDPKDTLWTSDRWQPGFGRPGTDGEVMAVAHDGTDLFIGGDFQKVEGRRFNGIAHWDGKDWHTLGEGLNAGINANGVVYAIAIDGDNIYVGGQFRAVGGIEARNIARFDRRSRTWHTVDQGIGGIPQSVVTSLLMYRGELVAGGRFVVAGSTVAVNIARWNDTKWRRVGRGTNDMVRALATDGSLLYAGGDFTIAGAGVAGDEVFATGQFITAALNITVNVARWNSVLEEWTALTPGSGVADQEDYSWVSALAADSHNVYVGGLFSVVDTFETPHVARFDRDETVWYPLGEGLDKEVMALAIGPDGALYAGGRFLHSGTTPMRGIARWDGEAWEPLGAGIEGDVVAIAFGDGKVYAGGLFDRAGDVAATNVAAWDTATGEWEALGAGLTSNLLPIVEELVWQNGTLFAAGFFAFSGTDSVRNIARFRNGGWEPLGSGIDFAAFDMVADRGDIYVTGSFMRAGNKPSPWIALWHDPTLSVEEVPERFAGSLLGAPNPTAGDLIVRYSLPSPTTGRIVVADATGREIAELYAGRMESGEGMVIWHPHETVAPGVYLCRLETGEGMVVEKVVLVE